MTVSQTPKISQKGKELLDAKLAEAVNDPLQPAQFFGVTSAEGPLYYNCGGDLVLGEPDKGQVNEDTSEYRDCPPLLIMQSSSSGHAPS